MILKQTESNLFIDISPTQNKAVIKGNSFVPDPKAFYAEFMSWAKTFRPSSDGSFVIEITPGYYSTSNIQVINLFLRTLEANCNHKLEVLFNIEKEDEEDMEETIYTLMFNTGIIAKRNYF